MTERLRAGAPLARAALLLALAACAQDPGTAIQEAREGALSWAASAHMAFEGWTDGRLTTAYTRATLDRCQRGLEEERTALAATPDLAQPPVVAVAEAIAQMSALAASLAEAVGKEDHAAAARSAAVLLDSAARLRHGDGR